MPRQIIRRKANGGFNVKPSKYGGFLRLMRGKTQGSGLNDEVYDNLNKGINTITNNIGRLKIKSSKPRKYISLNL